MVIDNQESEDILEEKANTPFDIDSAKVFVKKFNELNKEASDEPGVIPMSLLPVDNRYAEDAEYAMSCIPADSFLGLINNIASMPEEAFIDQEQADHARGFMVANLMALFGYRFVHVDLATAKVLKDEQIEN